MSMTVINYILLWVYCIGLYDRHLLGLSRYIFSTATSVTSINIICYS